jgi:hypothetical protein
MDWQPIETAPTDARVLLFFPWAGRVAVGRRQDNLYPPDWRSDDGEALILQFDPPTHWMPLPAPPTTK